MSLPVDKYILKDYFLNNPTWDIEDSHWKADFTAEMLSSNGIIPASICDLGCGAGDVLAELRNKFDSALMCGYDIAPDVVNFWLRHKKLGIDFILGDFFKLNTKNYDVLLLLDVIEHVADPFKFLNELRAKSKYFVFHVPLDLSAFNVLREKPILEARRRNGHIHYFTKNLALSLIAECDFKVIEWRYSGAAFCGPRSSWKTKLANITRKFLCAINKEMGVRVLGGETLFVLAQSNS